jgi:cytochrome c-type biogenesis protein CcmH/NrfF
MGFPARKRFFPIVALVPLVVFIMGAGGDDSRFSAIGRQMICNCGCGQPLLECNHVGCTVVTQMREEIDSGLQRSESNDLILQGFVQKYGSTVLAAPTTSGFNRVAWIMPFAIFFAGILAAMFVIRNWRLRAPAFPSTKQVDPRLLDRARKETEL